MSCVIRFPKLFSGSAQQLDRCLMAFSEVCEWMEHPRDPYPDGYDFVLNVIRAYGRGVADMGNYDVFFPIFESIRRGGGLFIGRTAYDVVEILVSTMEIAPFEPYGLDEEEDLVTKVFLRAVMERTQQMITIREVRGT